MFHRAPVTVPPDDAARALARDGEPRTRPGPPACSPPCDVARAIATKFREEIGGAYEVIAAQIELDHAHTDRRS